jgi:hypothetical protein
MRIGDQMDEKPDTQRQETNSHQTTHEQRSNLTPGLNPAVLAVRLNERLPRINAVIERKEKSQIVTQDVMLLEFNY